LQKLKNKLWVLLAGMAMFAAVVLFMSMSGGKQASAEDGAVCVHEYGEGVIHAPTCAAEGYTEYVCTLCGASYKDNYTGRTEHTYSEVVIAPTCTHEGYTTHFCTGCGYEYTDDYTAARGHAYTDEVTKPTCTEGGYTTHACTVCGHSYKDSRVEATGHNYETELLEPTCTEGGHTTYTCTVCEYSYISDYTEPTGHSYTDNEVKATCVSYGYVEHVCDNCSDRYVSDYVKPLGHDFEERRFEASEGQIGYILHICKNCDYSYVSDFVTSGDGGYTEQPGEPEEPESPDPDDGDVQEPEDPDDGAGTGEEHTHDYVAEIDLDEAEQTFTIVLTCDCGEPYEGAVYVFSVDADGNVADLTDDGGVCDYSRLYGHNDFYILDESGNVIYEFSLDLPSQVEEEPPTDGEGGETERPGEGTEEEDKPGGEIPADIEDGEGNALSIVLPVILVLLAAGGITGFIMIKKKNKKENK